MRKYLPIQSEGKFVKRGREKGEKIRKKKEARGKMESDVCDCTQIKNKHTNWISPCGLFLPSR